MYCGHCGEQRPSPGDLARHERCDRALGMEPPRFCSRCRRRMLVQVTPTGWTARCSSHGEVSDGR
ncbi:biotin synthase auxiliary protein BsaP [Nocardioides pyridinolyticus]